MEPQTSHSALTMHYSWPLLNIDKRQNRKRIRPLKSPDPAIPKSSLTEDPINPGTAGYSIILVLQDTALLVTLEVMSNPH